MEDYLIVSKKVMEFIDNSPTAFHAVATCEKFLLDNGFKEVEENQKWNLEEGKKYFVKRNGSSIIAFKYSKKDFSAFNITASHSDSPCFKLKENNSIKVDKNYSKLNVEPYGGMIMSSWFDRALSIAGRLLIQEENEIKSVLVNIDKDLLVIPNLAIHMQRDINEGHKYNPQIELLPLCGNAQSDVLNEFSKTKQITENAKILSHDLFLYPRENGKIIGADSEYILSPRLDDLQCVFTSLLALDNSKTTENINVCAIFDNEEVGSGTKQGAGSTFLFDTLKRISSLSNKNEEDYRIAISKSFMISADNAHAVHPNYVEKSDVLNRNYINKGVVIKFNANQRYTTDAVSAAVFKLLCEKCEVPFQVFHNRSDTPGGSTLGNISNGRVSLNTIDIGLPQLAMHSAVETAGVRDTYYAFKVMTEFFNSNIIINSSNIKVEA